MTAATKRTYETICITKVDMPEEKFTALVDRCKSAVTNEGKGEWLYSDEWGRAKIAYTIGKDNRGRWTYFRFRSSAEGLNEMKRTLGINEFVLRSLTVRADENGADYEPIRANMVQDLIDRERGRDAWREERTFRRGGYGDRGGGGGGGYRRDSYDENVERAMGGNALPGSVIGDDGDESENEA